MKVSLLIKLIYGSDVTNHALTEKVDNFLTKFKFNNSKIYIRCKITLKNTILRFVKLKNYK